MVTGFFSKRNGNESIMKISATETILTGKWEFRDGHVVNDETALRIEELVDSYLHLMGRDASGWEALYRDPADGRLWELTYPQGELQGGGPRELRLLSIEDAKEKHPEAFQKG